jgi:hypothetical protein
MGGHTNENATRRLDHLAGDFDEHHSPRGDVALPQRIAMPGGAPAALPIETRSRFDLKAYQTHVQANLGPFARGFDEIPALRSDDRLDRVWRFIAIIFLAHEGRVEVVQEGEEIMVMQRETDREGQDVSGDLEEADGVEGLVG